MRILGSQPKPKWVADVAIIGNGSLGLSLARMLKQLDPSLDVAVIGPIGWPGAASTTAGAMLNCWAEMTPGTFENDHFAARFDIIRAALGQWDDWARDLAAETNIPVNVHWGTVVIGSAGGHGGEDVAYDYMVSAMNAAGVENHDAIAQARELLRPDPRFRPLRARFVPDGYVNSLDVMTALESSARGSGVVMIDSPARMVTASRRGGGIVEVEDGSVISAASIVVANGSFARELKYRKCDLGSSVLPLFYGGGSALHLRLPSWTEPPPELSELDVVIRTMDRGGACGFHLVPLGCPDFYFGASSGVWDSPEKTHRAHALAFLLDGVMHQFHKSFFHAGVTLRGPGYRPVSLDGFPLIGETSARGIWFLNGMKRDGFTSAPYLARELAQAILGRHHNLPGLFAPERSPLSYMTRVQAIDAAVQANIGGEQMHGLKLPPYRRDEWEQQTRKRVEAIYLLRGINSFGIHPELLHFYEYDSFYNANIRRFLS